MSDDRKDEERKTPSWQLPQEPQPDTDAYHIWTPRPLLRSIYWKPVPAPPFEAVSATYEIFLDQRAWLTMHEHVWQTPADKTPFGYLIGDLCEDPNAGRRFVNITAALPARFDFREDATEQISREATLALQLEVERRRGVLAGWYHRHLGGGVRMGENDVRTHHKHFSEPWQCAFVFVGGGERSEGGCFRSSPQEFAGDMHLPFYEMASNESLLARGVKRSYVDWSNYATVDEIRSEPPPRPSIELPLASQGPAGGGAGARVPAEPEPAEPADAESEVDAKSKVEPASGPEFQPYDAQRGRAAPPSSATEPAESVSDGETEGAAPVASDAEIEPTDPPEPPREEEAVTAASAGGTTPASEEPTAPPPPAAGVSDVVRPARIELDPDALPEGAAGGGRDAGAESTMSGEQALEAASLEREAPSRASKPSGRRPDAKGALAGKRKLVAVAGGGVVLLAVAAGGFLLLSGRGGAETGRVSGPASPPNRAITPPSVTAAQMDSAGRAMLATISRFYGQAVARDNGEATCEDLAQAFVEVENSWISYNTGFKAEFDSPLPEELAARDERLYAGVQDAELEFDQSGCPRP